MEFSPVVELGVNDTQSAGLATTSQSRQTNQRVKQLPNPKHKYCLKTV